MAPQKPRLTQKRRLILETLTNHGPLTRAETAEQLGYTTAAMKSIWPPMLNHGWITATKTTLANGYKADQLKITPAGRAFLNQPKPQPRTPHSKQQTKAEEILTHSAELLGVEPTHLLQPKQRSQQQKWRNWLIWIALNSGVTQRIAAETFQLAPSQIDVIAQQTKNEATTNTQLKQLQTQIGAAPGLVDSSK